MARVSKAQSVGRLGRFNTKTRLWYEGLVVSRWSFAGFAHQPGRRPQPLPAIRL